MNYQQGSEGNKCSIANFWIFSIIVIFYIWISVCWSGGLDYVYMIESINGYLNS